RPRAYLCIQGSCRLPPIVRHWRTSERVRIDRGNQLAVATSFFTIMRPWEVNKQPSPPVSGGLAYGTQSSPSCLLSALAALQVVGLLPQVRRQRLNPAIMPWFIVQPLQSFLHKPLYPLVGMATAQAPRGGSVSDRHAVNQE